MLRVFLSLCFAVGAFGDPIVEGGLGKITGKPAKLLDVDLEFFLGIPYAKPPLNDLRFALPQAFGAVGELSATKYSPICPQPAIAASAGAISSVEKSEDCLYLNIFRKQGTSKSDKKPVIAAIHGGGYVVGSSSDPYMNPSALAASGEVIVVNFNYRLGIFGFADMKGFAPGNLGLHDQRMALQWIQDHIADFGGDPDKVTVIGVSAGSMSLAAQIITPIDDKDLFQAAILDAGVIASNGLLEDLESSYTRVKKIAKQVGCPVDSQEMVDCLRKADVEELLPLSMDTTGDNGIRFFVATTDGKFIPRNVEEYVEENSAKLRKVRTIIGYARDEGTLFVSTSFLAPEFPQVRTKEEFLDHCKKLSTSYDHRLDFTDETTKKLIVDLYFNEHPESRIRGIAALQADGIFKCPVNNFVRSVARHNNHVYAYQFERELRGTYWGMLSSKLFGAFHFSPYLHFAGVLLPSNDPVDPEDKNYSLDAMKMITDFARTNNAPTFRGVTWPSFSESGEMMILNETPTLRRGLSSERNCRELFNVAGASHQRFIKTEL